MSDLRAPSFLGSAAFALVLGAVALVACGGGASASCKDMCTGAGFSDQTVDEATNEINCMCKSGSGIVSAEACTKMCSGTAKKTGKPFSSGGGQINSCQCS